MSQFTISKIEVMHQRATQHYVKRNWLDSESVEVFSGIVGDEYITTVKHGEITKTFKHKISGAGSNDTIH